MHFAQLPLKNSIAVFLSTPELKSTLCNFCCRNPVMLFDHPVSVGHTDSTDQRRHKWRILSAASEVLQAQAEVLEISFYFILHWFYFIALIAASPGWHKHIHAALRTCAILAFIVWVKTSRSGPYTE